MSKIIKKGFSNKLHYYIHLYNKYVSFGISVFWMKAFGIYFKKNGGSLDIHIDILMVSVNIYFWDGAWKELFKKFKL